MILYLPMFNCFSENHHRICESWKLLEQRSKAAEMQQYHIDGSNGSAMNQLLTIGKPFIG